MPLILQDAPEKRRDLVSRPLEHLREPVRSDHEKSRYAVIGIVFARSCHDIGNMVLSHW